MFTIITRRSSEASHVAVAGVTVPLLHARTMIRAKVMCALFPCMKASIHITARVHQRAWDNRVRNQVSAFAAEVQRRQASLETVSAKYLLW